MPVRLNTNESPEPPPAAWRDAFAAELSRDRLAPLPRPRRHRPAGGHRRPPRRRPGAGLRRQRLERGAPDAAARLRRPRPHGRHVRADLPAARPHRPHHRHRRGRGRAGRRLLASTWPRSAGCSPPPTRSSRSSARPTTRPGMVGAAGGRARGARAGARPRRGGRGLRPVRPVVGARPGRRRPAARGHPHLLQDVVDGGRPARLPGRAGVARGRAGQGRAARTTSTPPSRSPAAWPCASPTRWRRG